MGPSDEPTKRRPTREQEELLARISNPQQQRALISAIEDGEDIPSYAWTPVTEESQRKIGAALENVLQKQENARRRCREEGTTFDELVEFDPEGTAEAIQDDTRLLELIARMKAGRSKTSVRPKSESVPEIDSLDKQFATGSPIVKLFLKISRPIWKTVGRVHHFTLATVRKAKRRNPLVALSVFLVCFAAGAAASLLAMILQAVLIPVFMVLAVIHVCMSAIVRVFRGP
jgi:hypothetical protein